MFLALFLFLFSPIFSIAAEDCQSILIEDSGGAVKIRAVGEEENSAAMVVAEESLEAGESLITAEDSWADLRFCDGSTMRVGENSEYKFESAEPKASLWQWSMSLLQGSMRALVEKEAGEERIKMIIETPHSSMGVRGTEFVVDSDGEKTELHTLDGEVLMGGKGDGASFRQVPVKMLATRFQRVEKNKQARALQDGKAPAKTQSFDPGTFLKERGARGPLFRKALLKGKKNDFRERVQKRRAYKTKLKTKLQNKREANPQLQRRQLKLPGNNRDLVPGPNKDRFKTRRKNN